MTTNLNKTVDTSYLQFDAYNMKNLITQFLSEDETFTDQVYEGSNLSVLIDIFAQHFQVMLYYINQSAGESLFSDSTIYENMNRIVKLLNYSPRGYSTSAGVFNITNVSTDNNGKIIPLYSYIDTDKTDDNGEPIYYSTVGDYYIYDDNSDNEETNVITMYNGQWKIYERTFIAEGLPYETITLTDVVNNSDEGQYTAYPYIDVWVKRASGDSYSWVKYQPTTEGMFLNGDTQTIYDGDDTYFELRLNEYKQYELKFGDGIHGAPLEFGDELYIAYMTSNGQSGELKSGDVVDNTSMVYGVAGIKNDIVEEWYGSILANIADTTTLNVTNTSATSSATKEGDVDDIRENAPQWFKSQGRLITKQDYAYFIKSRFYNDIVDVTVMNNWDYLGTFYAWLYNVGTNEGDPAKYLNPSLSSRYGYVWADSCDSNNVYLWLRMKNDTVINRDAIENQIKPLKVLTSETVYVDPLDVKFIPCAFDDDYDTSNWDSDNDNYIEVYIDNSTLISAESVRSTVNTIIVDYFSEQNQKIGTLVDFNDIYNQIRSIRGVKSLRTVYKNGTVVKIVDGLSFAYWTPSIISGSDKSLTNGTVQLEQFMFPELNESSLLNRIEIIKDSVFQNTVIEY
jgi:hypothetical protein